MKPTYLQNSSGIGAKSLALVLLAFLFGISLDCLPQGKQANTWYFGVEAGVDFNQGSPPAALMDGQAYTLSGSGTGCISDEDGNLLFYSDGHTIWNKEHQPMQNGQYIGFNSTQGALIIPFQASKATSRTPAPPPNTF
ncbi:MAG: hypothetical protein U5Q03_02770 [Bacteroidota bacterium]|nr:hypothetical protein [Bacteroidota bacterium]